MGEGKKREKNIDPSADSLRKILTTVGTGPSQSLEWRTKLVAGTQSWSEGDPDGVLAPTSAQPNLNCSVHLWNKPADLSVHLKTTNQPNKRLTQTLRK